MTKMKYMVGRRLAELGFSPAKKGYAYLRDAIYEVAQDEKAISSISRIYADIAFENCTSPTAVERAIRYIIRTHDDKNPEWNELFEKEFPPPKKVIAVIAEDVRGKFTEKN